MPSKRFDLGDLIAAGMKIRGFTVESPEDPEDKSARLRQEFWSFLVKDLTVHAVAFLFLLLIGGYCCYVVARNGVVSAEARAVFPLLTTLFGGVVGLIIGKAGK